MKKEKTKTTKMSPKQKLFIESYVATGFNGRAAALKAGYSPRTADVQASKMLRIPKLQAYLRECRQKLLNDNETHAVDWLNKVETLSNANIKNVADWDPDTGFVIKSSVDVSDKDAYGISEIQSKWNKDSQRYDFKVKMVDRAKALDMKGKFIGTLSDGFEVTQRNHEEDKEKNKTTKERNDRLIELLNKVKDEPK